MENPKEQVKQVLLSHCGRLHPITAREMALKLAQDDRQVRLAIRSLIADGLPVASAVQAPYGYFLIETAEEAREYKVGLKSRLIEDALRLRDFRIGADNALKKVVQGRLV